jgi:ParB/RepB/Spo0J family partition protein
VSIEKPDKAPFKRRLVKESPFARLTQRTQDVGEEAMKEARLLDLTRVRPNPNNPRRNRSEQGMRELIEDVKARGILQPPIVRPIGDEYEIVVGERRYLAAQAAGLTQIPVIVRELNDQEARIISLVENIQREDLSFEDEARYFEVLSKEYGYSIRQTAELVNKSKSYVEARLLLLKNPHILAQVQSEKLGLHEATLLARMGMGANEMGEGVAQSVREKDRTVENVREKDNYRNFPLVQPIRRLTDFIRNTRSKIENAPSDERHALIKAINELEEEIQVIKYRLDEM